jgi:hypothetical protein
MYKRKALSINEENLIQQNQLLQENYSNLKKEFDIFRQSSQHKLQSNEYEKEISLKSLQETIEDLENEKINLIQAHSLELKEKLQEKSYYYENMLGSMKEKEVSILKNELNLNYLNNMNLLKQEFHDDLLKCLNEEREKHFRELENLKSFYSEKERTVTQDLLSLEALHSSRIQQYEHSIRELVKQQEILKESNAYLSLDKEKKNNESILLLNSLKEEMEKLLLINHQQTTNLKLAHEKEKQSLLNEKILKENLMSCLNQQKLLEKENIEFKSQLTIFNQDMSKSLMINNNLSEKFNSIEHSYRIQREEISMLELEMNRYQEENKYLKKELLKYERLIYGVSQQNPSYTPKDSGMSALPEKYQDPTNLISRSSPSPYHRNNVSSMMSSNASNNHMEAQKDSPLLTKMRTDQRQNNGIVETRKAYSFQKSRKCEHCLTPQNNSNQRSNTSSGYESGNSAQFVCHHCHKRNSK